MPRLLLWGEEQEGGSGGGPMMDGMAAGMGVAGVLCRPATPFLPLCGGCEGVPRVSGCGPSALTLG